jgi:hypothetical protein
MRNPPPGGYQKMKPEAKIVIVIMIVCIIGTVILVSTPPTPTPDILSIVEERRK